MARLSGTGRNLWISPAIFTIWRPEVRATKQNEQKSNSVRDNRVFRVPDGTETRFHRLNLYVSWVLRLKSCIIVYLRRWSTPETQDGGRQTPSTYISASIADRAPFGDGRLIAYTSRKHGFFRWNGAYICHRSWDISTSGLAAAILGFRCRSTSDVVGHVSSRLGDPENMGFAVGTAHLVVIEAEIQVLPVWRPSYWVSGVGQGWMLSEMCPVGWATPKTWVSP
jgi:hypothetical protein